ncbi:MAG TPA: hypothetical protein VGP04_22815, partial [Pseudonocardiaceae bacterium]|nr:hypothetical protein [Pseudonocardiaceae bacterium]
RLAQARYRILAGLDGSAYAVELDGPAVARPLRGWDGLRQRLARAYHDDHKSAPSGSALTDALAVLEGMAADCDRESVALRLTRYGQGIVIDLGTADGRCIIVEPGTWWIANHFPVLTRKSSRGRAGSCTR